jgi:hypothetical protein
MLRLCAPRRAATRWSGRTSAFGQAKVAKPFQTAFGTGTQSKRARSRRFLATTLIAASEEIFRRGRHRKATVIFPKVPTFEATGGAMNSSGSTPLTERAQLFHSIVVRDNHFSLNAAVLLRGIPGWYLLSAPTHSPRSQGPALGPGGGSSASRHSIFVSTKERILWLNRSVPLPLTEFNVVLLDRFDDPIDLPIVQDMFTIDSDLGAAPSEPVAIGHAFKHAAQQLKGLLEDSARVRAFLHS